ncbi:TorA maturation chaperone TorD [Cricetibacter osteomyelitidis]|uniref:TorA maturation chaperone TorD n=1 Tax=Cricetibacter osteomyelitidis TaxID=1521931 RepID=A0A4R2SZJ9_9PAST|nr:molecular chaperone [Cricetibacter osteomyelitidis]TCP94975.1 TorA maturation chaperone TorD [Cricetibacter osteomyelitidis]
MTAINTINNFSMISRLFGNLFYRSPKDPILSGVFGWLNQQGLSQIWALSTDAQSEPALKQLQTTSDFTALELEYQHLFGDEAAVPTTISAYGIDVDEFVAFRNVRNMPAIESADHFALLLLTASWLEDNVDSVSAQQELFEQFLLPCAAKFLGKVEAHSTLPFYRALAQLTRDILSAMADELEESAE